MIPTHPIESRAIEGSHSLTSSLSEVAASDWVASLSLNTSRRHFVVAAYDEIIEVIARSCKFEVFP
jgi:hypothetical protein